MQVGCDFGTDGIRKLLRKLGIVTAVWVGICLVMLTPAGAVVGFFALMTGVFLSVAVAMALPFGIGDITVVPIVFLVLWGVGFLSLVFLAIRDIMGWEHERAVASSGMALSMLGLSVALYLAMDNYSSTWPGAVG